MSDTYRERVKLQPEEGVPAHLQPTRYRIYYSCDVCGHTWNKVTTKVSGKDPLCPSKVCKKERAIQEAEDAAANMAQIIEERRAPGVIGSNAMVNAVDTTAKIVMEDHGMTDLRDNVREGDTLAPKLPGKQQIAADNYFGTGNAKAAGATNRTASLLKRRAIAGAFKNMAGNPQAMLGNPKRGDSPLRPVASIRNDGFRG